MKGCGILFLALFLLAMAVTYWQALLIGLGCGVAIAFGVWRLRGRRRPRRPRLVL